MTLAPTPRDWQLRIKMRTWCVVLTKYQQEELAQQNLERQGFRTYLPKLPLTLPRIGRPAKNAKCLFPGHIFVELDFERQDVTLIHSTYGATGLLPYGLAPAKLPSSFIDLLQAQAHRPPLPDAPCAQPPGLEGAAATGLLPKIQKIFAEPDKKQRVILLMDIISLIQR